MPKKVDLTNQKFGRLLALRPVGVNPHGKVNWECQCDCGKVAVVTSNNLRTGTTTSCGCWASEWTRTTKYQHGSFANPEYRVWLSIKTRCDNPRNKCYRYYGGRGINVCQRWRESFSHFLADMGPRPSPTHSIDRINNNGHYEPDNCRWATDLEQMNNTSRSRRFTYNGETLTIPEWARRTGMKPSVLYGRIVLAKWPIERAMTEPLRRW